MLFIKHLFVYCGKAGDGGCGVYADGLLFVFRWGLWWNAEFGRAADACSPSENTEGPDGSGLPRVQSRGFSGGSWESLRLSSPAQRAASGLTPAQI